MNSALSAYDKIGKSLINLIYPNQCEVCRAALGPFKKTGLCNICRDRIKLIQLPSCGLCGRQLKKNTGSMKHCRDCVNADFYFERNWAACRYNGVLKECIHLFKFKDRRNLLPVFGELMVSFARRHIRLSDFEQIVPVPLHRAKIRERGFNQAGALAGAFSKNVSIPCATGCLIKVRRTHPQNELSKEKRMQNLKGAFRVSSPSLLKNKSILLIDDVFTTGSTLNECAGAALASGARRVECLVLARG